LRIFARDVLRIIDYSGLRLM